MALIIRRVFSSEQKARRLENLVKFIAASAGTTGRNRAIVLAQLQAQGFTLQEIQNAVAAATARGEIEVIDDGT